MPKLANWLNFKQLSNKTPGKFIESDNDWLFINLLILILIDFTPLD